MDAANATPLKGNISEIFKYMAQNMGHNFVDLTPAVLEKALASRRPADEARPA